VGPVCLARRSRIRPHGTTDPGKGAPAGDYRQSSVTYSIYRPYGWYGHSDQHIHYESLIDSLALQGRPHRSCRV